MPSASSSAARVGGTAASSHSAIRDCGTGTAVAASSASYDLYDKLNAYRRNGVREYLAWRVDDRELDWFVLRGGRYERLAPGEDGIHRSEIFPGLWLDAATLVRGDLARVHAVLAEGLASPGHAAFAARNAAALESRERSDSAPGAME